MATVSGMTATAIKDYVSDAVVNATLDQETGVLTLTKKDGSTVSAGVIANTKKAVEAAYPVGSIYLSTVATNPTTLLGVGTWNRWGVGRVPVSLDVNQTEFNTVEKTGGEKTTSLAVAHLPSHNHSIAHDHASATTSSDTHDHFFSGEYREDTDTGGAGSGVRVVDIGNRLGASGTGFSHTVSSDTHSHTVDLPTFAGNSGDTGGNQPHNNLQPYITCYMWKRVG